MYCFAETTLSIGQRHEDTVGRELSDRQFHFFITAALFLDSLPDSVIKRIHIDDAVNVGFLLSYWTFDGSDLGGAWRDVKDTNFVVFIFAFFLEFASDIHCGDVDRCLDGNEIIGQTWEFYLNKTYDGRTECRYQRKIVGMFVEIFVLGVSVYRIGAFRFKDMSEAYLFQDGVYSRHADVVRELS